MNKNDLLKEIQENQLDSFEILSKGYLNHFDLDQEIFSKLLEKLVTEAKTLDEIGSILISSPQSVANDVAMSFSKKVEEFETVVESACWDEVMDVPYISECVRKLTDVASPELIKKISNKIEAGFSIVNDGKIQIANPQGDVIYSSEFIPAKEILGSLGLNTDHPYFPLFYFGVFPKKDLPKYRTLFAFKKHFFF